MEISNSNNTAIAAFQSNAAPATGAQSAQAEQTRATQTRELQQETTAQPAASTQISISEEAQALFRAEQNTGTETAQLQSGDKIGDKPK